MGAWKALQKVRRGWVWQRARSASPRRLASREALRREVERLREENERLRQELADAEKQLAEADQRIADAERQIADLERQLAGRKKDSTNSSKPPSSDGPAAAVGASRAGKTAILGAIAS